MVMKNEELVKLRGGYWDPSDPCPEGKQKYGCVCQESTGAWVGCYTSQNEADQTILTYCSSQQGSCTQLF